MSDTGWNFKDISPYEGKEFEEAINRLKLYPQFLDNFTDIISRRGRFTNKWKSIQAKRYLRKSLDKVSNYTEVQEKITCDLFLDMVESSSINDFTFTGIDSEDDTPHVYISNHRDIVLDTALLALALYRSGKEPCEMVIGDNLLANQFITDMFKINGAITVRRNLTSASDLKTETLRLSHYIRYCIEDKKRSVWIAQKSGRSKDGIDNTSPAILKMLYLSFREEGISVEEFFRRMHIVPVAISYQYDPCDVSKSHEQIRKLREEGCYNVYKKKKYEDILDVVRGIRHYKGDVNISVGKEIQNCDDIRQAVSEIDRQIHLLYKLYDTNYFAYDLVNGTELFKDNYSKMNTKGFIKHYKGLNRETVDYVYNAYANPVQSRLNEEKN